MRTLASASILLAGALGLFPSPPTADTDDPPTDFASVFDEHWQRLHDEYPFFELYGVDWQAEREEHRPRALAAKDATEFAWEIARLLTALQDRHVDFVPSPDLLQGWSIPDIGTVTIDRRVYVHDWREARRPVPPASLAEDAKVLAEIVAVQGTTLGCGSEILVAGPVGTELPLRLRWPDGSETEHSVTRPSACNLPPPNRHFGDRWVVAGRVGSIGYLRVKTFDPSKATLGPAGKMTPILRERLRELLDTEALILDVQGNGGGVVGASDPFLSHFLEQRRSYRWGNSGGRSRTLVPRTPRYSGEVVVLVDRRTGSGGEWAARILRDAGRAQVIGDRTMGAEAAVHRSTASDGSTIQFSAWPMAEPGVTPFQDKGVDLDHPVRLTIESVRELGYEQALERVRRARLAKALEILGAPAADLDELEVVVTEANEGDEG